MSSPIADYALVGDMRSTALISREGSIDWLCWPRHDSPALFLRLLDDAKGGACEIAFGGGSVATRRYLPGTNVLETTFRTATGRSVLLDAMPVHGCTEPAEEGPDTEAEGRIVRLLRCEQGEVAGRFVVRPTFDYARRAAAPQMQQDGACVFEAGEHQLIVRSSGTIAPEADAAAAPFRLQAGGEAWLTLGGNDTQQPPRAAIERTRAYWENWSKRCRYRGPYRDAVLRGVLCLKLLTYAPTGAIIAAPTTSLPEAVPGERNFDYRFAWLRDASFTVTSFAMLGYTREAGEYLRFLRDADRSRGRDLRLMYGIAGEAPEETIFDHLSGWDGVGPVRIGNAAGKQTQHDVHGEFLLALDTYLEAIQYRPKPSVAQALPELLGNVVGRALAARHEPDHGIWEMRTGPQHMLHTKALLWVALDRAVRIGRRVGGVEEAELAAWEREASALRAEYLERGWNPARGAYTQAYGSDALDAAVLRTVLFGAIGPRDERLLATLALIGRELGAGDLLYRYRMPDGLEGQEATFAACAFWRVGCLALAGRTEEARPMFERLLGRANDVGLFAEEIDEESGALRGNFPQGFTHMAIINHALRLERLDARREERGGAAMAAPPRSSGTTS